MKYSNSNFGLDGRGAKLAYFILNKVQAAKMMKGSKIIYLFSKWLNLQFKFIDWKS